MNLFKLSLALVGASLFIVACAPISVRNERLSEIRSGHFEIAEAVTTLRHDGAVEMLYFNPENRLVLRHPDGTELVLSEGKEDDARLAYAVLHSDGKDLYALWRPKLIKAKEGLGGQGEKFVYVRVSQDDGKSFGPVQRLNQSGGAFAPVVASNGAGDVYVAYTDERNGGLDLYLNLSHNRGASWKSEDFKLNDASSAAFNPSVVTDGDRVYVSWMTRSFSDKQFKIMVRTSEDRGEHWLPPVAARSAPTQPATPMLAKIGKNLILCWADVDAVRCNRSVDHNTTWSGSSVIEDSEGAEGVFLSTDPRGRAHILVAKKPKDETTRLNLFHAVAEDGADFLSLQRLNGGVPYTASTILPVLAFGDDGSALAAWVDMRYLRPVIAGNYSADGGKTWLNEAVVLAGKKGLYHFFPTVSYAGNGKYRIAWQESANRGSPTSVVGTREYLPGSSSVQMPLPDVARLKERVDAFWSLREADKWDKVYDYMDPFFREANSRSNYVKTQGLVKYYEHRLAGEPQITGMSAAVPLAFVSEVPEIVMKGKPITVPKKELEIKQEWIWVDGDWYQVFRDLMNGSQLLE